MKRIFYIVLAIAILVIGYTFVKQKSIANAPVEVIAEDVIEINPDLTGGEDETIITDSDEILPEEDTGAAEPETIISE